MNPGAPANTPAWLAWSWVALLGVAVAAGVYALGSHPDAPARAAWRRYVAYLDTRLRLLYSSTSPVRVAQAQLAAALLFLVLFVLVHEIALLGGIAVALLAPRIVLASRIDERRKRLDQQLESFLTTLANALKASPSLGDALATTATLIRVPLRDDVEFALKENRLGVPLDQALLNMAERTGSRAMGTALTTILIGRQTGGDLPAILERSAATLREMSRLEGVLRTKTAEGRAQAWVLAAVPFVLVVAINAADPGWLAPLTESFLGYVIMAAAGALWLAAIFAARKILDVDL